MSLEISSGVGTTESTDICEVRGVVAILHWGIQSTWRFSEDDHIAWLEVCRS